MPLIPYDPFQQFRSMEQAVEGFFQQVSGAFGGFGGVTAYGPKTVQVTEAESEVIVNVEMQGIAKKEDVVYEVEDGCLLILKGSTKSIMENKKGPVRQYSSFTQSFQRVVQLPAKVRVHGSTTDFHNGRLTIRLPKK